MATNTGDLDRISATERVNEDTNPELYAKTATLLAALSDDADPAELVAAGEKPGEDGTETGEKAEEAGDSPAAESADDDASSDDDDLSKASDDTDEREAADQTPTLPAAIRRSLRSYEWTDDEIDEAFKRDPEGFLPTASKIHATRVRETQEWAALGRARRDEETAEAPAKAPSASDIKPDPNVVLPDGGVAPLDFDKLALDSGFDKETLIKAFGPVSTVIDAVNKILPVLNEGVETVNRNKQAEVARQVDQFFQSDDLTPYTEFYGKSWDEASNEQIEQRNSVLELADHMIVGAGQHGRTLNAVDAMELAHHTVSSDVKDSVIRQKLAKQVEARRKSVTLKPTSKTTSSPNEAPDRDQVIANAAERLRAVFN